MHACLYICTRKDKGQKGGGVDIACVRARACASVSVRVVCACAGALGCMRATREFV